MGKEIVFQTVQTSRVLFGSRSRSLSPIFSLFNIIPVESNFVDSAIVVNETGDQRTIIMIDEKQKITKTTKSKAKLQQSNEMKRSERNSE